MSFATFYGRQAAPMATASSLHSQASRGGTASLPGLGCCQGACGKGRLAGRPGHRGARAATLNGNTNVCVCVFNLAEFDKFLEERAKAAERIPSLPSPPQEAPTLPATTNPPGKKKPERSEDALFAL